MNTLFPNALVKKFMTYRKSSVTSQQDEENEKWSEKAVRSLIKRLKKIGNTSLGDLDRALLSQEKHSRCIVLPRFVQVERWLIDRLVNSVCHCVTVDSVDWLVDLFAMSGPLRKKNRSIDWLIDWLTVRVSVYLTQSWSSDWLIDWLNFRFDWFTVTSISWLEPILWFFFLCTLSIIQSNKNEVFFGIFFPKVFNFL